MDSLDALYNNIYIKYIIIYNIYKIYNNIYDIYRLHMDSLDALYVNIHGNLTFHLFSPEYSQCMRTIAPTYYTQPNGFSFQYKEALGDEYKGDITTYYYSYANNISDPVYIILYIILLEDIDIL